LPPLRICQQAAPPCGFITADEYKSQITQFGADLFSNLAKEDSDPDVRRTAYRLLNILGAHGKLPPFSTSLCSLIHPTSKNQQEV